MKAFFFLCVLALGLTRAACAALGAMPFDSALEKAFASNEALRRNESTLQTFYAYRPAKEEDWILVYWPEARYLIRLENYRFDDPKWAEAVNTGKFVDLEKEVAATSEEAANSLHASVAADVLADIRRCLDGRRVVVATPPERDLGPLNTTVVRVKPQALKYDNGRFECVYDVAELRVASAGPLADQIISVAIPTKGTALYQNVVKSGTSRLRVESWEKLATPGRGLKVTADVKSYLKAKRENAPVAVLYASTSDVEPL